MTDLLDIAAPTEVNEADILKSIHGGRGLMWESIENFLSQLRNTVDVIERGTEQMDETFPVKHHFDKGLYTREIFMPKGTLVISLIHKQSHPSFFMSGEMSVLMDTGEVVRMKAPVIVNTEIGTQRVAYMHEDCVWACVYKTDALTIHEAEAEVYTENYRDLPQELINHRYKTIC